jgi:hypothetical protein
VVETQIGYKINGMVKIVRKMEAQIIKLQTTLDRLLK